jgi:serine beta-lactamase-like protein LACTB
MGQLSGLGTDDGDEGPFDEHCDRPTDGIKLFKDLKLLFEPGTRFRVSTFGWILVSAAVEAAANQDFYTFMKTQVFAPLGLDDMAVSSKTEPVPGRATFYFPRFAADNKYGPEEAQDQDYSCYGGAYAFLATPSDLVRFGMATQAGQLLKPETLQLLQTSQRLRTGEETGYGLGWSIQTIDLGGKPTRTVGHDGSSIGGVVMSLITVPERGITVAVMTNTSWADTPTLAKAIVAAFAR